MTVGARGSMMARERSMGSAEVDCNMASNSVDVGMISVSECTFISMALESAFNIATGLKRVQHDKLGSYMPLTEGERLYLAANHAEVP